MTSPLPDLPLRTRHHEPAHEKARELIRATGLPWLVEYREDTKRWHVVLDPGALRHVTPVSAAAARRVTVAPLGSTPPPRRRR